MEKPQSVRLAVNLLWASLAIGVVKSATDLDYLSRVGPAAFVFFVMACTLAVMAFLFCKIGAGRNWARITLLVLFILGIVPTLPLLFAEFARSPVRGVLSLVQLAIQACALFLMFTKPGSDWFRKEKTA